MDAAGSLVAGATSAVTAEAPEAVLGGAVQDGLALMDGAQFSSSAGEGALAARDNPVNIERDTARTYASLSEGGPSSGKLPASLGDVLTAVVDGVGTTVTGVGQVLDSTVVTTTGSTALGGLLSDTTAQASTGLESTTATLVAGDIPGVVDQVSDTAQTLVGTVTSRADQLLTNTTGGTVGLGKVGSTVNGVVDQVTDSVSGLLAGESNSNPVYQAVAGTVGGVVDVVGDTVATLLSAGSTDSSVLDSIGTLGAAAQGSASTASVASGGSSSDAVASTSVASTSTPIRTTQTTTTTTTTSTNNPLSALLTATVDATGNTVSTTLDKTGLDNVVTGTVAGTSTTVSGVGSVLGGTLTAVTGSETLGSTVSTATSTLGSGLETTTGNLVSGDLVATVDTLGNTVGTVGSGTVSGVTKALDEALGNTGAIASVGTAVGGIVDTVGSNLGEVVSTLLDGTINTTSTTTTSTSGISGSDTVGTTTTSSTSTGSNAVSSLLSGVVSAVGGTVSTVLDKTGLDTVVNGTVDGVSTTVAGVGSAVGSTLTAVTGSETLGSTVSTATSTLGSGLSSTTGSLTSGEVVAAVDTLGDTVGSVANGTVSGVTSTVDQALGNTGAIAAVGSSVGGVTDAVASNVGETVAGLLGSTTTKTTTTTTTTAASTGSTTSTGTSTTTGSSANTGATSTAGTSNPLANALHGLLSGTVTAVGNTVSGVLSGTGLDTVVTGVVDGVSDTVAGVGVVVGNTVQALTGSETLANTVTDTTGALASGLSETGGKLVDGDVLGTVDSLGNTVGTAGSTAVTGVTSTVDQLTGSTGAIAGVGSTVASAVNTVGSNLGETVSSLVTGSSTTAVAAAGVPTVPTSTGSSGLIIGTGGLTGSLGQLLDTSTSGILGGDGYIRNGNLAVSSANIVQAYSSVSVLGLPVVNLSPVGDVLDGLGGVTTGSNSHLTLIGGVTSDSYIYNINNGDPSGLLGLLLPDEAPAWATECLNVLGAITADCWAINAAQDYQVLIGDGATANGSKEVVIGTNASHTLPLQDANDAFPGDGVNDPNNPTGVPTADYDARLGHSVVIGDEAAGTANGQTILGAEATSDKANTVVLGYKSNADRGGMDNYTAYGLTDPQTSIGEVSVGSDGRNRQITHVAAGSEDTDAVNVAQLKGAISLVDDVSDLAVKYDLNADGTVNYDSVTLSGSSGTKIGNVAAGAVTATSTDAVNGSQLNATNAQMATYLGGTTAYDGTTGTWTAPTFDITSIGADGSTTAGTYGDVTSAFDAVDGSLTNLNTRIDNLSEGDAVKYFSVNSTGADASATGTEAVAVGADTSATGANSVALGNGSVADRDNTVSVGSAGSERQITNLAAGTEATDAVNVSQLQASEAGAVRYDTNADGSVNYDTVTLGGTSGTTLSNVAAGAVTATSTDAVNGSQLNATNAQLATYLGGTTAYDGTTGTWTAPSFDITSIGADGSTTAGTYGDVTSAFDAVDGSLTNLNTRIDNLYDGDANKYFSVNSTGAAASAAGAESVAIGADTSASADNSVALGNGSVADRADTVSVGSAGSERQITNVAAGTEATDAVNVSQLQASEAGAVRYDTNADGSVNYGSITLGGSTATSATVIGNLAAGEVSASSSQAINGAQLYAVAQGTSLYLGGGSSVNADGTLSAPTYVINNIGSDGAISSGSYNDVGSALDAISDSLANVSAEAAAPDALAVHYDADANGDATNQITLSGDGSGAAVGISNLAAGEVSATSTAAINGSQLYATNTTLASYLGGTTSYDSTTGTWTAPTFTLTSVSADGTTTSGSYSDVTTAFSVVDSSLTNINQRIDNLYNSDASVYFSVNSTKDAASATGTDATAIGPAATASGTDAVAIGDGATATADNSVALGSGSVADRENTVSVGSAGSERQITNVAAGTEDTDAVNVAQLNSVKAGGVQYDTNADGSVNYSSVTLSGTSGTTISNVAAGSVASGSTDAINGSQLYETNQQIATYLGGTTSYDSTTGTWTSPTFQITSIGNDGSTTTGSYSDVSSAFSAVDSSLTNLNQQIQNLQDGASNVYFSVNSEKAAAAATGTDATAIGPAATASGTSSVALGDEASATADNSVALGSGSVADRANTVSVGSEGSERQITNVAAGTEDTDAVNVAQLNSATAGTIKYDTNSDGSTNYSSLTLGDGTSNTSTQIHNVAAGTADTDAVNLGQLNTGLTQVQDWSKSYTDQRVNQVRREASAGIASAMAIAGLPQAYEPGRSMAAIAGASYNGESGFAIGVSGVSEGGRWVYKLSGSTNSRGQGGFAVGAGIQW